IADLSGIEGEQQLRLAICNRILAQILRKLQTQRSASWQALRLASTFSQGFGQKDFTRFVRDIQLPPDFIRPSTEDLLHLDRLNLVNWTLEPAVGEKRWAMHALVRGYLQDTLESSDLNLFRAAHRAAGLLYFPLSRKGRHLHDVDSVRRY